MKLQYILSTLTFLVLIFFSPQILFAQTHNFAVLIDGAQANGGVGTGSLGTGIGWGTYDESTMEITVRGNFSGLTGNTTVCHIHNAPAGSNGGVVVPLTLTPSGSTSGQFHGSGTLNSSEETELLADGMYVNIHSSVAGSGEIRGQMIKYTHSFETLIDGAQANGGVGTGSLGTGYGVAVYNQVSNEISALGTFEGLTGNTTVCHIHIGTAGNNGGVIVGLTLDPSGTMQGNYRGNGTLSASQETALLADGMYVNIHSNVDPGGEIRGQLILSPDSDFDGVSDLADNCIDAANPNQINSDGDDFGATCDCDDNNPDDTNLVIDDLNIATGLYAANISINSAGSILNGTGAVTFQASNTIFLNTNFLAEEGSDFVAKTEDCMTMPMVQQNPSTNEFFNNKKQINLNDGFDFRVFPNPVYDHAVISYVIEKDENVSVLLIDAMGKKLSVSQIYGNLIAGHHQYEIDSSLLKSGIYTVVLNIGNQSSSKRIIVVK